MAADRWVPRATSGPGSIGTSSHRHPPRQERQADRLARRRLWSAAPRGFAIWARWPGKLVRAMAYRLAISSGIAETASVPRNSTGRAGAIPIRAGRRKHGDDAAQAGFGRASVCCHRASPVTLAG